MLWSMCSVGRTDQGNPCKPCFSASPRHTFLTDVRADTSYSRYASNPSGSASTLYQTRQLESNFTPATFDQVKAAPRS